MKEIWESSKEYRISDKVHMTEMQVLHRLKNDGIFPYIDRPAKDAGSNLDGTSSGLGKGGSDDAAARTISMQNAHVCFYMRR